MMNSTQSSELVQAITMVSSLPPPPPPPPPLSPVSVVALLVIYVLIFYLFLEFLDPNKTTTTLTDSSEDNNNNNNHNNNSRASNVKGSMDFGLSIEELKKIPSFYYGLGWNYSDCVICLEGFRHSELCRIFPGSCKHVFHAQCVDPWLMRTLTCPICRTQVRIEDGFETLTIDSV